MPMFSPELEALIQATLADGVLTENEKLALVRRAEKEGVDLAELEIYIDSLIQKRIQTETMSNHEKMISQEKERKGNVCHRCGESIPPLTRTCPSCGAVVGSNETVGDKELTKLVDEMEAALVNLKSADSSTIKRAQAEVESLLRKAATFYGDNKKVQILVFELEKEMKNTLLSFKKQQNLEVGEGIGIRLFYALLWAALLFVGVMLCFIPFFSSGYRKVLGNLWDKFIP